MDATESAQEAQAATERDGEEGQSLAAQRDRLTEGLRVYGADYNEFGRRFATTLDVHVTDAGALVQILFAEERGAPLSPARLSERITLSSGATTALLNRLEKAGHIVRTREHQDRRIVTLRGSQDVHEKADAFFGPLGERIDTLMARYPAEQLRRFEAFLHDMHTTMNGYLAELGTEAGTD
ncbi:MarR family transcriptional regulator [Streptomyces sp. NBC_00237]|uniref:MarR family winged helix-turn-helix transcriptional regulator n=1 Tax=Streptomyces sp. NBC_00237 TaxID=2975687 RepID=UPI002254FE27|nr:MarR family transcriptional regulator [Streptomyces sp. NBC_00237]MCX5204592.1 MarR family transcriptional regulator [Streptomyces sp. NBC_00237]